MRFLLQEYSSAQKPPVTYAADSSGKCDTRQSTVGLDVSIKRDVAPRLIKENVLVLGLLGIHWRD